MAKNSPFPCDLDSKPAQSVGTPLHPVACAVQSSEQTDTDTNRFNAAFVIYILMSTQPKQFCNMVLNEQFNQ